MGVLVLWGSKQFARGRAEIGSLRVRGGLGFCAGFGGWKLVGGVSE